MKKVLPRPSQKLSGRGFRPPVGVRFLRSGGIWNAPLRSQIFVGMAGDQWSAPAVQLSESVGCIQRMFVPNSVGGGGCLLAATHILPPDVKLLFHYFIRFHTRFSLREHPAPSIGYTTSPCGRPMVAPTKKLGARSGGAPVCSFLRFFAGVWGCLLQKAPPARPLTRVRRFPTGAVFPKARGRSSGWHRSESPYRAPCRFSD